MKNTLLPYFALFLIQFCFWNLNGQSIPEIFHSKNGQQVAFTSNDTLFLSNIVSRPTVTASHLIKVDNVMEHISNGWLQFKFPYFGRNDAIDVFAVEVDYDSTESYIWKGEIPNGDGGLIIIISQ